MIKKIIAVLVALIVVFIILASMQPDEFKISRSTTIHSTPTVVFEQVNNLRKWDSWSPWAKLDPNAKSTFEGPESGTGAVMGWAGNNQVGEGRMTITESRSNEFIQFQLEFLKPFETTNMSEFQFQAEGTNQTVVIWSMSGKNNLLAKAFSLFMDCEKMLGPQFDQGLAQLKAVSEAAATTDPSPL
jgi:hypothetical protein